MSAPAFTVNQIGIPYLTWTPVAGRNFYIPAGQPNLPAPVLITVGASPFTWANPTGGGVTVLIGGGVVTNVSLLGTYPPSAPYSQWVTAPSGTFLIGIGGDLTASKGGKSDCTFNVQQNQTIVVTYQAVPQMYYVVP